MALAASTSLLPGPGRPATTVSTSRVASIEGGPVPVSEVARQGEPAKPAPAPPATPAPTRMNPTGGPAQRFTPEAQPAPAGRAEETVAPGEAALPVHPSTVPVGEPACILAECLTLDAATPGAPFVPVATGLNDGVEPGNTADSQAMSALGVSNFRGAPAVGFLGLLNWSEWDAAAAYARTTTLILSDLWQEEYGTPYPPTPWSNWSAYQNWVTSTVREIVASGQRVTYWEVFNEPGWNGYYSPSDYAQETPADLLQQFLVTYQAIKSVDPAAQIVGPSTGLWSLTPTPPNAISHQFDLGTFLRFAAAHHLQLAAVAWHDNAATPSAIYADAEATEALIHQLPALGDPPMILQEYASQATQPIPGWDVGYLAAVSDAGFESADRSCWNSACYDGELDGLLAPDDVTKTASYWERLAYAAMSGRMLAVTTTDPTLVALGTVAADADRVSALIGRDAGCASAAWCQAQFSPGAKPAPPASVEVRVLLPWRAPHPVVTLAADPFVTGVVPDPPAAHVVDEVNVQASRAGGEWLTFTIPAYADGTAYSLTVSA